MPGSHFIPGGVISSLGSNDWGVIPSGESFYPPTPVGEVVVEVLVAEVVSMDTVTVFLRLLVGTTNAHIVYAHHVLCQHLQVFLKAEQLLMVEMHIRDIHCTASSGES